jgi:hypothetical protein
MAYRTVHQWARYRLKGKLKVPRPVSEKQKAGAVEEFKKTVISNKSSLSQSESFLKQWKKVRYWSEDEAEWVAYNSKKKVNCARNKTTSPSAMGLYLLWLYGAVEPLTGASFF